MPNDLVYFCFPLPVSMRVRPTLLNAVDDSNILFRDLSFLAIPGFTWSISGSSGKDQILLVGNKTGHGQTDGALEIRGGEVSPLIFDAEI